MSSISSIGYNFSNALSYVWFENGLKKKKIFERKNMKKKIFERKNMKKEKDNDSINYHTQKFVQTHIIKYYPKFTFKEKRTQKL